MTKVNVGWVGPGFKFASEHFDINSTRTSTVCAIDDEGYVQVRYEREREREMHTLNTHTHTHTHAHTLKST